MREQFILLKIVMGDAYHGHHCYSERTRVGETYDAIAQMKAKIWIEGYLNYLRNGISFQSQNDFFSRTTKPSTSAHSPYAWPRN